mmetsp:Transcript_54139/g.86083  ORF Transcript_54139/g.86083 Transcript_54139/m.86083 type:complete len:107 (+) Transcript_54139:400-720(+)
MAFYHLQRWIVVFCMCWQSCFQADVARWMNDLAMSKMSHGRLMHSRMYSTPASHWMSKVGGCKVDMIVAKVNILSALNSSYIVQLALPFCFIMCPFEIVGVARYMH